MAAAAILDFWNFEFLMIGKVKGFEMLHHAKYGQNPLNLGRDMAIFRFFKMAAAAILDFRNNQIFDGRGGQEGQVASSFQISSKSAQLRLRYGYL